MTPCQDRDHMWELLMSRVSMLACIMQQALLTQIYWYTRFGVGDAGQTFLWIHCKKNRENGLKIVLHGRYNIFVKLQLINLRWNAGQQICHDLFLISVEKMKKFPDHRRERRWTNKLPTLKRITQSMLSTSVQLATFKELASFWSLRLNRYGDQACQGTGKGGQKYKNMAIEIF